ncbi:DUF6082 family protein [Streptomyces sp. NBC_01515]|uniref:DUF6082 family protein n=1 Tax=Streptomyces sp. NBC_01515 TaxID=2903890 RepID=UPI00386E0FA4
MATQNVGIQGLSSAVKARIAGMIASLAGPTSRHRREAALAEQHRLHFALLCKAMDDPALAGVLNTYETEVPPEKQRQYLFANALYANALYYHRIGALTLPELHGHLRVMCQNQVFREYWAATKHHRKSLPDSSEEAGLGRIMDDLIQELDDSDTDEWWVVGETPGDSP